MKGFTIRNSIDRLEKSVGESTSPTWARVRNKPFSTLGNEFENSGGALVVKDVDADKINFDNELTGMISDNVQDAIEEAYTHGPGDIYDDTERVIGTWFNEPLYGKVLELENGVSITTGNWQNLLSIPNIKFLARLELYDNTNPVTPIKLTLQDIQIVDGVIRHNTPSSMLSTARTFNLAIIEYTKSEPETAPQEEE